MCKALNFRLSDRNVVIPFPILFCTPSPLFPSYPLEQILLFKLYWKRFSRVWKDKGVSVWSIETHTVIYAHNHAVGLTGLAHAMVSAAIF